MKINAIGKKVILKAKKAETVTPSGMILKLNNEEIKSQGIVVSAGPECLFVKEGQTVLFEKAPQGSPYGVMESDGIVYMMLEEKNISAILEG